MLYQKQITLLHRENFSNLYTVQSTMHAVDYFFPKGAIARF